MEKNIKIGIAVAAALAVVGLFFIYGASFAFPGTPAEEVKQGLIAQDEVVGTGEEAQAGKMVSIHYTGKLEDGTVFDTSMGKDPFTFPLGVGVVVPGMEQGLLGMKVGGKRLLIIPPHLGFGAEVNGPIPANSTIIFEVELVKVEASQ
jgi:FKBP-type peptidyl-prolyl cis-trans isomerase